MRDLAVWSSVVGMIGSVLLMIPSLVAATQRKQQTDLDKFLRLVNKEEVADDIEKHELIRLLHIDSRDYWLTLLGALLIFIAFGLLLVANVGAGAER